MTITVTNVNEAPVVAPEVLSFDEGGNTRRTVRAGAAAGTNVGAPVTATKPDGTRTGLTYRIYLNIYFNTPVRAPFRIDQNTGQLETTGELTKNFYILVLQVRDQQGKTDAIGVTIRVRDMNGTAPTPTPTPAPTPAPTANRAPSFTEGPSTTRSVAENTPAGRNIGLPLAATDLDNDSLTYALGGTDSGHFALSGNQLRTSGALDYEGGTRSYSVTVTVSDGNGGSDTIAVTITVTNVNEASGVTPPPASAANEPPTFDNGGSTSFTVTENSGTAVGTVGATDPESDTLTYALDRTSTDHALFNLNTGTGELTLKAAADFEDKSLYSVTVTVHDGKNAAGSVDTTVDATIDVTVNVNDVDEPPDVPTNLQVVPAANELRVSWTAPDMAGKPPITGDDVQYKLSTATAWTDHTHNSLIASATIHGLTANSTYNVRVRTKNHEGSSGWATANGTPTAPVAPTGTPTLLEPPGAPTNLVATPGHSNLQLSWTEPDMAGKPPITHYELQYRWSIDAYWLNFSAYTITSSRVITIDYLSPGLSYGVRVRAVNSDGKGDWVSVSGTTS